MLYDLLFQIWKRLRGHLQWRTLWLFNSKFMVSVAGIVSDRRGRILLQRHRHWIEDVWGLPGGIVKAGEQLEEAFKREVFEETGVNIENIKLLRVVSGYNLRMEVYFQARLVDNSDEPILKLQVEEVLEARFFPLAELPPNLLPAQRNLLEAYKTQHI
jgi:ADP-ribose pyrophosphatase YjhB (NUDIX family)